MIEDMELIEVNFTNNINDESYSEQYNKFKNFLFNQNDIIKSFNKLNNELNSIFNLSNHLLALAKLKNLKYDIEFFYFVEYELYKNNKYLDELYEFSFIIEKQFNVFSLYFYKGYVEKIVEIETKYDLLKDEIERNIKYLESSINPEQTNNTGDIPETKMNQKIEELIDDELIQSVNGKIKVKCRLRNITFCIDELRKDKNFQFTNEYLTSILSKKLESVKPKSLNNSFRNANKGNLSNKQIEKLKKLILLLIEES